MASGSFTGTTNNQYITAKIEWSSVVDPVANRSIVTASLYVKKSASSSAATSGTGKWSITIDSVKTSISKDVTIDNNNSWVKIGTGTASVAHNSDGSKSIQIIAAGGISGTSYTTTSCSGTAALDTIPRQTAPTFDADAKDIGTDVVIKLDRADESFYHTLTYSCAGVSGAIDTNVEAEKTWTIPLSLIDALPGSDSATLYVIAETYTTGGVLIGTAQAALTVNVPASVVPVINAITPSDTGGVIPAGWGLYVKGKSTLHVKVTASGINGSSIIGYQIDALGLTRSINDVDVGVTDSSGTITVSATVTDSRGRTASGSVEINVEDYVSPEITLLSVIRANDQGAPVDNGTFAKVTIKASGSSVSGKNTVTAKIYHMRSDLAEWTLAKTVPVEYSIDSFYMISEMIAARSYAFKVEVSDEFSASNPSTALATLQAEGAVIGWLAGGIGVSFGKAAEEAYKADFAWRIHARQGAYIEKGARVDGGLDADALTLDNPLPVTEGGTGAADAAGARTNLGAAASDHTHALDGEGITGTLPILKGGTGATTAADAVNVLKAALLDLLYPVGSIYISTASASPASFLGGTWTQIKDKFLLASGDTYSPGSTGGASTHKHLAPIGYTDDHQGVAVINGTSTGSADAYRTSTISASGSSASGIVRPYTQSVSSMPPYLAVYVWERTA